MVQQQEFEWTREHGDRYRESYDRLSFEEKQWITNMILTHLYQVAEEPSYLVKCLNAVQRSNLRILELGGYDGAQALHVLQRNLGYRWDNYDISWVANYFTKLFLKRQPYMFHLLEHPFTETELPDADVFYSSKTLEHFKLHEIYKILEHTKAIPYQVHVVDWFWRDDTHVVEHNAHSEVTRRLKVLGYKVLDEYVHPERSHIFVGKPR